MLFSRIFSALGAIVLACLLFWAGTLYQKRLCAPVQNAGAVILDTSWTAFVDTIPYYDTIKPEPIPADVDTNAVIKDYFSRVTYSGDTTVNELRIKYSLDLSRNRLQNINYTFQNLRPTEIVLREKINAISVGGIVGVNLVAPSVVYQRGPWQYDVSYNLLDSQNNPTYSKIILGARYRILRW